VCAAVLTVHAFEAGHVVSDSNGGLAELDNLRVAFGLGRIEASEIEAPNLLVNLV
jgi:hypothetical protein